ATVLGVAAGNEARAYPIEMIAAERLIHDRIGDKPSIVLWLETTKTAAAFRPTATPPAKVKATPRTLTIERDGKVDAAPFRDKETKTWPVTADAELKVKGWWGRLEQFEPQRRVWAWFQTDRAKKPVAVFMLADELSEQDIHGGAVVKKVGKDLVLVGPKQQE